MLCCSAQSDVQELPQTFKTSILIEEMHKITLSQDCVGKVLVTSGNSTLTEEEEPIPLAGSSKITCQGALSVKRALPPSKTEEFWTSSIESQEQEEHQYLCAFQGS